MSYWSHYKPYVSVSEKKRKAQKKLVQLRKKNPDMQPVTIEGKKLASTWWGKAWNKNLENYADYDNRIGRGRSYLRHGAILDLKITLGKIKALVQGSESSPYLITIKIKALPQDKWQNIQIACQGEFESLQSLLDGEFPKDLGEIFTAYKTGLFPGSSEISFNCSCPDGAYMCKHIAATLYGIGARLDSQPDLFFTLRDVQINDLISKVVEDKKLSFLQKAKQKSSRVIADSDLSSLFGIEMEKIDSLFGAKKAKNTKLKAEKTKNTKLKAEKTKNTKLKAEKTKNTKLKAEKTKNTKLKAEKTKNTKKQKKLNDKVGKSKIESLKPLKTKKTKAAKNKGNKIATKIANLKSL